MNAEDYMSLALELAKTAELQGEVPVGAVIVHEDQIIAKAYNQPITLNDPCAHAEILALREAGQNLGNYRLKDCTLYVTLEPCPMCLSAMIHARLARCVFGASDPKTGALGGAIDLQAIHHWNHRIEVESGLMQAECSAVLLKFFRGRRG